MKAFPTRRRFLLRPAAFAGLLALGGRAAAGEPKDQGIGGTGVAQPPDPREEDRGIGGTGVIGTIRRFGSIVVNDLRIAYPKDARIFVDGRPATASALKLGHVVRVVAVGGTGALSTRRIDVTSEVVGVVEAVAPTQMTVLGQTVSTAALHRARRWNVGDQVAVFGLRRPDGAIVASLVELNAGDAARVAGPVKQTANGGLAIGTLRLAGVDAALIGQRAILEGQVRGGFLQVARATREQTLLGSGIRTLSVEAYVGRSGADGVVLGSGLLVGGNAVAGLPASGVVRAVLSASVAGDGSLNVDALRRTSTGTTPDPFDPAPRPVHGPAEGSRGLPDTGSGGNASGNLFERPDRPGNGPAFGSPPPNGPPGFGPPGPRRR